MEPMIHNHSIRPLSFCQRRPYTYRSVRQETRTSTDLVRFMAPRPPISGEAASSRVCMAPRIRGQGASTQYKASSVAQRPYRADSLSTVVAPSPPKKLQEMGPKSTYVYMGVAIPG